MDRDELSKQMATILKELVKATQQDRIDLDEDIAREQILSLLASVFEKAEKYEEMLPLTEYMAERARKWDQVTRYYPNVAAYITDPVRYTRKKEVKDA